MSKVQDHGVKVGPLFVGVGATLAVVVVAIWMAVLPVCGFAMDGAQVCQSKWASFLAAPPNEVGDTLAGFAGVLAFIWIIVTVWLQSQELSEQRRELVNQREEMEGQRRATEEMAKAMQAQADLILDEKKRRDEDRAKEALDELSAALADEFKRPGDRGGVFSRLFDSGKYFTVGFDAPGRSYSLYDDLTHSDDVICFAAEKLRNAMREHRPELIARAVSISTDDLARLKRILRWLDTLISLKTALSRGQLVRVEALRVEEMFDALERFMWEIPEEDSEKV